MKDSLFSFQDLQVWQKAIQFSHNVIILLKALQQTESFIVLLSSSNQPSQAYQ